jgi:hypothetical protein
MLPPNAPKSIISFRCSKVLLVKICCSPGSGEGTMPVFDIAVIGQGGDAVIAGTAAPRATVELLRNGELQDRTAADQSGQFAMVPPRFPPGDYELTLKSTQRDGKQATSQQSVAVSLKPPGPRSD